MRILLDTCVLLWWVDDGPKLGPQARELIADGGNDVYVSAVTAAEIAVKTSLGKLKAPGDLKTLLAEDDFTPLPLTVEDGMRLRELPWHHRDPFDRMLIAQAQGESLTVLTSDRAFADYEVAVIGARA